MASVPRVSIGLPVYNGEDYLPATLDSILAQTFEDFELIISDNASTDETASICRSYARRDPRIRYVRQPTNLGLTPNFNAALEEATAPYFRWAGGDDLLAPTCLEACVEALDAHPEAVLAAPRTQLIDATGAVIPKTPERPQEWLRRLDLRSPVPSERLAAFLRAYVWIGCGSQIFGLMRRAVVLDTPGLGNYPSSDYLLLAEMALRGEFVEVDEPLYLKRMHEGNSGEVAGGDGEAFAAHLDPKNRGTLQWLQVRWLAEFVRVIQRVPLTAAERRACYRVLFREYVYLHKRQLVEEILALTLDRITRGRQRPVQDVMGFKTRYHY